MMHGDTIEYQFSIDDTIEQSYSTSSHFEFTPISNGEVDLKVQTKDDLGATCTTTNI